MISRFSQLLLAFTTVTPLLLSIAVVLILLYPFGYCCGWEVLIHQQTIPYSFYWWVPNLFVVLFIVPWIWTKFFLGRLSKGTRSVRSITLSNLQPCSDKNILSVVALLPPWVTLVLNNDAMIVLTMTSLLSLVVTFVLSRQGYLGLILLLCGYRLYEGVNANGMKMLLLSRRVWRNHQDVRKIAMLSDNFALIL